MFHVISSSVALTFVIKMHEKQKSTSLSAIQVKNQQTTIITEEKFDTIS
jgi:hypothetical protein